ncbi:hypothetical protein D3C79_755270 [compost metagenome]
MAAAAVGAQGHGSAIAPEGQRHVQLPGVFVQQAQVELDQVPANDRVRIVLGQPLVEAQQQLAAVGAELQVEVQVGDAHLGRAQHVDLTLAATFEGDAVELAAFAGFDVQRHQAQRRTVAQQRFELGLAEHALGIGAAREQHRGGDEALHQVALRRANVGLEHVDPGAAQALLKLHQLPVLGTVQPCYRTLLEITQAQGLELDAGFLGQHYPGMFHLRLREERHRGLGCEAQ